MTKVTAQMSVSLDGFYTGPRDTRGPKDMSGWMRGPEAPGFFRVTRWVVDAMATYRVNKNVDLQFNVYNVLDKDYVAAINKSGYRYTPGAPRTFRLTANFAF